MNHARADLRSFLEELEHGGRLLHVRKPADVTTQVPALCSETSRPIVFENLPGHDGWRLADCLLRDRAAQALALGCEPEAVIAHYAERCAGGPGELVRVEDSPAQEVTWTGDQARLDRLPVPVPSEGVEVPHLELAPEDFRTPVISGSVAITRDPDQGLQNCFFTMAKLAAPQRLHCYVFSPHTWRNIEAHRARGERAPIALVLGCHPAYELAAAYTGPHEGFSELSIAARLLGAPVPLVPCRTVDLEVPAYAEVIIEGLIDPEAAAYVHTSAHTDTHAPFVSSEPFVDVTAITMRGDPIYRHIQPTRFTDHHAICEFIIAPMLLAMLRGRGLDVHDVTVPLHSCINCAVIQMTPRTRDEAREALLAGMSMPFFPRLTVAVDRDVDIHDARELLYALSIRVDPARDVVHFDGVRSFNLEPVARTVPGMEETIVRSQGRYAIDATKPPLAEPERRALFQRLRARGEGRVSLADFL